MSAQTYDSIKQTVAIALSQVQSPYTLFPDNFAAQFEQAISYSENRITRDIPLLAARETVTVSSATSNGNRTIDLSALDPFPMVVEELMLMVSGALVSFNRASLDFINRYWPVVATTVTPSITSQYGKYFATSDAQTLVIAPTPDAVYDASIVALVQPATLSAGNPTTYLSRFYPELLIAGILVYLTGALTRNFGAQADEPQSAQSWETQFMKLLDGARDEEARRRGLKPDMPMQMAPAVGGKQ